MSAGDIPCGFDTLDLHLQVENHCSDPMPHNPGVHEKHRMCVGSQDCDGLVKPAKDAVDKMFDQLDLDVDEISSCVEVATSINAELLQVSESL